MTTKMQVCRTRAELDDALQPSRRSTGGQAYSGVFVPTMGALHEGHASLVRQAAAITISRSHAGGVATPAGSMPVIVSIFVNPTQFNDPADFQRYPQTLDADLALCQAAGATIVFVPSVEEVYPKAAPNAMSNSGGVPPLPRVATEPGLEDAKRPGHFAGVCQVVKRLFELVRPDVAVFGEKDWQQLQVIRAMTRELGLPIEIIPGRTVREVDGLAMSSRNRFLKSDERAAAASLSWGLCQADRCETVGEGERMLRRIVERAGLEVEYAVIREAPTLMPVARTMDREQAMRATPSGLRALIAARLGSVRLIDNSPWGI